MAYVIEARKSTAHLDYLPLAGELNNGQSVTLKQFDNNDEEAVFEIVQHVINVEGDSYPQQTMNSVNEFRAYYVSHDVFVCRTADSQVVVGAFYVKPNFPGRCSHICNGGFVVHPAWRRRGVGEFLGRAYLRIAPSLGYRASLFNLVFVNNTGSVRLWQKLGFQQIARLPRAGNLKNIGFTDALQFYYSFENQAA